MGTHITIIEFVAVSAVSIIGYAFIMAFYETFIKRSK
jgi:hypothetical protein